MQIFAQFFFLGETLRYSQLLLTYKQPFAVLQAKQVDIWYLSKVGNLYLQVNSCRAFSCYLWGVFDSVFFTVKPGSGCEVFHDHYIFPNQIKLGLICIKEYNFFLKTHYLCIVTNNILVFLKRLNDWYNQEKSLCHCVLLGLYKKTVEFKSTRLIQMPKYKCRTRVLPINSLRKHK